MRTVCARVERAGGAAAHTPEIICSGLRRSYGPAAARRKKSGQDHLHDVRGAKMRWSNELASDIGSLSWLDTGAFAAVKPRFEKESSDCVLVEGGAAIEE